MSNFFNEKKGRSENLLKPKIPFKWVFMDIITSTAPKSLTSKIIFLIVFELFMPTIKLQNSMIWRKLQQKELWITWICYNTVGWWHLERISADSEKQFTSTKFKEECQTCGINLTLAAL